MFFKTVRWVLNLIIPFIFIACGGSQNDYFITQTGTLNDSKVIGVSYNCGSNNGITNEKGEFSCRSDSDEIKFKIGAITLGTIASSDLKSFTIYPADLVGVDRSETDDFRVVNILQILQSLDEDANPNNGIVISKATRERLANIEPLSLYKKEIDKKDLEKIVLKVNKKLINEKYAIAHYEDTLRYEINSRVDTVPPAPAKLISLQKITNKNSVPISIEGERRSKIFVNGNYTNVNIDSNYSATFDLNSTGEDGYLYFIITLQDDLNQSSDTLNVKVLKDTIAPEKPTISNYPKYTNKNSVKVTISGEANATLLINNKNIGKLINGSFQVDLNTTGIDEVKKFNIQLVDLIGNKSESLIVSIVKDTIPPKQPKLKESLPFSVNINSVPTTILGEKNSILYLNRVLIGSISSKSIDLQLNTNGRDGKKSFILILKDLAGNESIPLIINIIKDTTAPIITIIGDNPTTITHNLTYRDRGATAMDAVDGNVTVSSQGIVNSLIVGDYKITYIAVDRLGNRATKDRLVKVLPIGKLSGRVIDLSGNPLKGASIEVNGKKVFSNSNGQFNIDNLLVTQRAIVSISKESYLTSSKIITIKENLTTVITVVLTQPIIRGNFNSENGITILGVDESSIVFPPNIYRDSEGKPYLGDVNLTFNYYPITTVNGRRLFPGDFDAIDSNGNSGSLESYGFAIINLIDKNGNRLDIDGKATITIPVDTSLGTPPNTIPLWYYDELKGVWIEDGEATYNSNTGKYEGEITRIATYNLDIFGNSGNLQVCVEDINGTKVSNAYIQLENNNSNWYIKIGPTGDNGYIKILGVRGNTKLNLSAYTVDGKYGEYNGSIIVTPLEDNTVDSCIVIKDGNASFVGSVKEISSNLKMAGVKVILRNNNQYIKETVTNSEGRYRFDNISSGLKYSIDYKKENYNTISYNELRVGVEQTKYLEVVKMSKVSQRINSIVSGIITNALDGNGIDGVTLIIRKGTNNRYGVVAQKIKTTASGDFSTTLAPAVYTAQTVKNGYITSFFTIVVISGKNNTNQNFSISPTVIDGNMRIVLTWGENPSDLDSHLVREINNSTDYHIYYGSIQGSDANLDHDDTTGYGPETTTINNPKTDSVYTYYVHHYGGSGNLKTSGAKVNIAFNNTQKTFNVPNEDGIFWKVFEIVNGVILPCSSNCIQSSEYDVVRKNSKNLLQEEASLFRNLPSKE